MEYLSNITTEGTIASSAQGYLMGATTTMPAANADREGLVIMYTGTTTEYYKANTLYKCVESSTPGTYEWSPLQLSIVLEADDTPTEGSTDLITSGGVYTALAGKEDALTFDTAPTENSDNPVTSDGIYDALALKQDALTIDSAPTQNSTNPVQSGGVYSALSGKQDSLPTITGNAGKVLAVNTGATAVEWTEPPENPQASVTFQDTYYEITDGSNLTITDNTTYYTLVIG